MKWPDISLQDWHPWFAWYPVLTCGEKQYVWMETVERRIQYGFGSHWWQYQLPLTRRDVQ